MNWRRRKLPLSLTLFYLSRLLYCDGVKNHLKFTEPITPGFDVSESENAERFIVKLKSKKAFHKAVESAKKGGRHIMTLWRENSEVMTLKTLKDVKEMEEREDVEYVERDTKVYKQAESTPTGIAMVEALEVSDEFVSNQKVCIIDSGYDRGHPDLPPEGDTLDGTTNGAGPWYIDGDGHGTHVAGTIAAIGGNNQGVVGVNRNGKLNLHIVKVFGDNGDWAWSSTLIAAANACIANGSTIISMSLGGPGYSSAEESAFESMYNNGVLIIAAAGNNGSSNYSYPGSYGSVISVGAVNSNKSLASFSQRNNQVDLVAPGVGVESTYPGGRYRSFSGTSMATPHVSGVAALVWSHFPSRSAREIRQALESSAEDLGPPGRDDRFGHGLVNAKAAYNILDGGCLPVCTDNPVGWHDSDGALFNCDWYALSNNCVLYGSAENYRNDGKIATEACCACNGGTTSTCNTESSSPTESPSNDGEPPSNAPVIFSEAPTLMPSISPSTKPSFSESPTLMPSISPSTEPSALPSDNPSKAPSTDSECKDAPENWHDSDGDSYDCVWYLKGNRCKRYGNSYRNYGKTAKEACCGCGGGSNPCEDVENWHDSGGTKYDCDWYKGSTSNCRKYGDSFRNFGYTANEACCFCKLQL